MVPQLIINFVISDAKGDTAENEFGSSSASNSA